MKGYFPRNLGLTALIVQLQALFENLNLIDNFNGFEWSGAIASGAEVSIPNGLRDRLPTSFIVTMAEGTSDIVKGAAEWTNTRVSIKNAGSVTATVKVYFYR